MKHMKWNRVILSLVLTLMVSFCAIGVNAAKIADYTTTNVATTATFSAVGLDGSALTFAKDGANSSYTGTAADLINGIASSWDGVNLLNAESAHIVGWVIMDFGQDYLINELLVSMWHDWGASDVVIQLSETADFSSGVTTIYNNDSDNSLGLGIDLVSVDSAVAVGDILSNAGNNGTTTESNGNIWSFGVVKARYFRATNNMFGNWVTQNYTTFSEIAVQAINYKTEGAANYADVAPVFANYLSGTYHENLAIALESVYADAPIYYTLDGSIPTVESTVYTTPILSADLDSVIQIRAITVLNGVTSMVAGFQYVITNPDLGKNIAKGLTPTFMNADFSAPIVIDGFNGSANNPLLLTDEIIDPSSSCLYTINQLGWAVLDLGKEYTIGSIVFSAWHDWWFAGIQIQIAKNADFSDAITVYSAVGGVQNVANTGTTYTLADPTAARYVRVTDNAKGEGAYSIFTELKVIVGEAGVVAPGVNVAYQAKNISVVGLDGTALTTRRQVANTAANDGSIGAIVDGDVSSWGAVEVINISETPVLTPGWVVIDFTKEVWVNQVNVSFWHDWGFGNVIIQLSTSADFTTGVTTVFSNDTDNSIGLGIAPVSLDPDFDPNNQWLQNMGALGNTTNVNGNIWNFDATLTRYVRVLSSGNDRAGYDGSSTYNEIQVLSCEEPSLLNVQPIVAVENISASQHVAFNTDKNTVLAALPTSLNVVDQSGASKIIAGSWASDVYDALVPGEYQFVFTPESLDAELVDTYELLNTTVIVDKVVSTITNNSVDKTYDGGAFVPSIVTNGATFTVTFAQGDVVLASAPVVCGAYIMTVTVAGDDLHTAVTETYSFNITKAIPVISAVNCDVVNLYTSSVFPADSSLHCTSSVSGTIAFAASQTLIAGTHAYNWTFTPADADNYESVTGTIDLTVETVSLVSIRVSAPTDVEYVEGQSFDAAGMIVTAVYNDGSEVVVTAYTVDKTVLALADSAVVVSYEGKDASVTITVIAKAVVSISATAPTKAEYIEGQSFDAAGMVVTAHYNDGSEAVVTAYAVNKTVLALADSAVVISYEGKDASVTITVIAKVVESISAIAPTKAEYIEGQSFDAAGMVVTAHYNDGSAVVVTTYTVNKTVLALGDSAIVVSYEGKDASVTISVIAKVVVSIAVTAPTKVAYIAGDSFDAAGMVVTATYNDGSEAVITDYSVDKTNLAVGDTTLTVTYEGKTATVTLAVEEAPVTGCSLFNAASGIISLLGFAMFFVFKKRF